MSTRKMQHSDCKYENEPANSTDNRHNPNVSTATRVAEQNEFVLLQISFKPLFFLLRLILRTHASYLCTENT